MIPIHHQELTERESDRVAISIRNARPHPTYFIGPIELDVTAYCTRWPDVEFVPFASMHFTSVASYNAWMLTPEIYRRFRAFEFILICQTDALLVKSLPVDQEWRFDYLGAPWTPPWTVGHDFWRRKLANNRIAVRKRHLVVGNGGLSLRRTEAFDKTLRLPKFKKFPNEDTAISYYHREWGIRLADAATAAAFFMELGAKMWRPGDPIPDVCGFHALEKFNPELEDRLLEVARPSD